MLEPVFLLFVFFLGESVCSLVPHIERVLHATRIEAEAEAVRCSTRTHTHILLLRQLWSKKPVRSVWDMQSKQVERKEEESYTLPLH